MSLKTSNQQIPFPTGAAPKLKIIDEIEAELKSKGIPQVVITTVKGILASGTGIQATSRALASRTPADSPTPADQTPAPSEQSQPTFEIDTKLQLLISSIPIANPGNIITSEYHNALRDAVRALASRIGLSISPTAEFQILTFSPNFLPMTKKDAEETLKWEVTLNRAAIPDGDDLKNPVRGGFVVQLPDNATIFQMIARGTRDKSKTNPKEFTIALKRVKLGEELSEPTTLISMDLKAVAKEEVEERQSVDLSKNEINKISNELIVALTTSDREIVNNETWMYFVTADWAAGAEKAAKFEINSIQILCRI